LTERALRPSLAPVVVHGGQRCWLGIFLRGHGGKEKPIAQINTIYQNGLYYQIWFGLILSMQSASQVAFEGKRPKRGFRMVLESAKLADGLDFVAKRSSFLSTWWSVVSVRHLASRMSR